ncbi:DMT family transporter [Aestuariispira insulae]|uniref:Drug/metabolite transporter (DMT)-like permease n=1 Tax=Aestuariispira insulae TaxID=1461337 RepID=A0A3D9HET6_9PROT|nr:DMT family transporter [Aestuariispira insulae]RED47988.1 drug/metabolite transporter (DMT)-like permease [Aestuariispira insulae]
MLDRFAPILFVLLWSTGFIGAKYGLPYAEPMTLLSVRMGFNVAVFLLIAYWMGVRWPKGIEILHAMVAGILIHGIYLGGVFYAIGEGFPAGLSALIVGLQPIVTAFLAGFLFGERLRQVQWIGLALGFIGVALVLSGRFQIPGSAEVMQLGVMVSVCSLFGITIGTLYQKRFCGNLNLIGSSIWQYLGAACFYLPLALAFEEMTIRWTPEFIATMAWLVLGLSVVAVLLLLHLIRKGEASKVASLFYLVPPTVALETYFLFDERLDLMGVAGMALVACGVWLVLRQGAAKGLKKPLASGPAE